MSDMFSGCSGLTSLNLSNFNTSAVKDMSEMFSSCSGLTSLNVSNFNTSAVTKMSYMFSGCSRLTSLNLSNFNTSTVTYMSGMFRDCYGLTSLNLSNFNTSKVIDMRGMFENCSSLKTILNPNTWRCKQSQDMFYGCTQLKGAVKYDESKVDATMANPITGYFTDPNPRAYVLLSEDEQTLTFFYDLNRAFRSDKTWDIDEKNKSSLPAWVGTLASSNHRIKKVVFDASFKDFRPTTTKYWFYDLRGLTTIEGLENFNTSEVTDMSEMFYGCSRLISLNFSYLNTSAVTDMSAMFSDCSGLTSLNLSNFNTSSVTNMGSMFRDCSSLTSLNLSNFNTSAVTNMGGMFSGCSRLTSLNISNFNTSKVTYMGGMFEGCSKLTSLNLSNFNTSAVTNMGGMFSGCSRLTSLNISNFNTSAVTNMSGMFSGCSGLKELNLSNFSTSKVTYMGGMFEGCSKLTSLNLSNFNTSAVTDMSQMFSYCSKLTSLNLSNFNTSAVKDMSKMFSGCSGLTELNVSSFNTSKVTDMRGMFSYCSKLTSLSLSNFNTSAVTDMSQMFYVCSGLKTLLNSNTWRCKESKDMFSGCTQLYGAVRFRDSKEDVEMANPNTGYFTDPNKKNPKISEAYIVLSEDKKTLTFYYDANSSTRSGKIWSIDDIFFHSYRYNSDNNVIEKVVFDESFTGFKPTTTSSWFSHLKALTTIEGIENLNTSAVKDMRNMFGNCSGLKELNLSNFNTSAVTDMREMFSGCSGLRSLNLSNFNTSKVTNMEGMFKNCSGLKELNVSNFNTSAVTDMSYMFSDCSSLKELNVSSFNTSAVTSMSSMFSGCSGLKELNVSNFNTSKVTDMSWMFKNCSSLKVIFNTNTWRCEKSEDMFLGCTQLYGAVKFDASKVDVKMANPEAGYFFDSNKKVAYVQQSEDQQTLTFYYDANRAFRSGKIWNIDEKSSSSKPIWAGTFESPNNVVTKVVFDASFKDFRPTTTEGWFYHLSELATIEGLENLNTSAVTDMSAMFFRCSGLKELNVSNFNTSKVTDMSAMFSDCSGLTSLNLSNFNTSAVTNMGRMFSGCSGLKELNVSNFNTSAVKNMSWMFSHCSGLKELNISNFNTSAVTNMEGMFCDCSGLTSLNLSNFNTSAVTDMGWMFSDCSGLTSLNLSNFNTSKVDDMRWMFENCSGLKTILNSNTWLNAHSQDMFKGCTQLRGAVSYNPSMVDAKMANLVTGYFTDPNPKAYVQQSEDNETLTFYYDVYQKNRSGETWNIVDSLGSSRIPWAGYYLSPNKRIIKVVFDASFKDFRPTTTKSWFSYLTELTKIEGLENLNTSAVTDMSAMFSHCSSLKRLNLSNFNTSAVTDVSEMFSACSSLKELNLSNFNTAAVTDMSNMFNACSSLKELNLSNFNTAAVKNMNYMFYRCFRLNTIYNSNTWQCDKSKKMFEGCTLLNGAVTYDASEVDVDMANPTTGYFTRSSEAYVQQSEDQHTLTFYYDNNRKLRSGKTWDIDEQQNASEDGTEKIPAWASLNPNLETTKVVFDASFRNFLPTTTKAWFSSLQNISTIEGIENLNTSAVTDMSGMFIGCSSLKELNVSNFNTSKVTDMRAMFANCSGLKELNLFSFNTSAVKSMWGMFLGCSSLTSLNLSNFNTSAVRDMSGMFSYCSSLKTIINTNTWRCEESQDMFKGCAQLNGAVKYDASKLDVTMANPTTGYFTDPNRKVEAYVLQSEDQHTLTFYYDNNRKLRSGKAWDINEKSSSSKPIWAGTYSTANKAVTKVVFDASFKDFRPTTTEGWFYHLSELATIEGLENLNTSAVTDMSAMFFRCSGLTSMNLSNFNTSKVTNMGWMFEGCSKLTSLNLSNFNTSAVTNMIAMFSR